MIGVVDGVACTLLRFSCNIVRVKGGEDSAQNVCDVRKMHRTHGCCKKFPHKNIINIFYLC